MKSEETIDYHIKVAWHNIVNLYNQIAAEFELTQASGFVLLNIDEKQGTPATKIAPLMGMKNTSLSRMLKNMEDQKIIIKRKDESDGRLVKIYLTDKGVEKKKIAKKVVREFNHYIMSHIQSDDLTNYYNVMSSINRLTLQYGRSKKVEL